MQVCACLNQKRKEMYLSDLGGSVHVFDCGLCGVRGDGAQQRPSRMPAPARPTLLHTTPASTPPARALPAGRPKLSAEDEQLLAEVAEKRRKKSRSLRDPMAMVPRRPKLRFKKLTEYAQDEVIEMLHVCEERELLLGAFKRTVKVWDTARRVLIKELHDLHTANISCLCFESAAQMLCTGPRHGAPACGHRPQGGRAASSRAAAAGQRGDRGGDSD